MENFQKVKYPEKWWSYLLEPYQIYFNFAIERDEFQNNQMTLKEIESL